MMPDCGSGVTPGRRRTAPPRRWVAAGRARLLAGAEGAQPSRVTQNAGFTALDRAQSLPFPRVRAASGPVASALALGALMLLSGFGAALVHVVEYHVGLSTVDGRSTSIAFMLTHCPVRGGLLVVLVAALLTTLLVAGELRALLHQRRRLARAARRLHLVPPPAPPRSPRRVGRLAALAVSLLCGQAALYALAAHYFPMTMSMRMQGVPMHMAVQGAFPLLPIHLLVAGLLAFVVWRLERSFLVLREQY